MAAKERKEESEFYKKLGEFMKVMHAEYDYYNTIEPMESSFDLKKYFSYEMLCNYRRGRTKISFFKLLKMLEHYDVTLPKFVQDFEIYCEMDTSKEK